MAGAVTIDSTVIKLHDLLKESYKACRTNHSQYATKLNMIMRVFGNSPGTVRNTVLFLTPGAGANLRFLRLP